MSVLQVQYVSYPAYDQPNNVPLAVLTFMPFYFFGGPIYYPYSYGTQNPSATPNPLFPDDAAALSYYLADATSQLLTAANGASFSGNYTSISLNPLDPSEIAAFSALTIDTLPDGSAYKKITSTEKTKLDSLATVASTGAYSDLTGKPSLPVVQAYEGTAQRLGAFPIIKSASVTSGVAVFHLTVDGLSTGAALFQNGIIQDSILLSVNDSSALYPMSWAFSNSNKTVTVTTNKASPSGVITLLGLNLLGAPVAAANGSVVKLIVYGY